MRKTEPSSVEASDLQRQARYMIGSGGGETLPDSGEFRYEEVTDGLFFVVMTLLSLTGNSHNCMFLLNLTTVL